MSSSVAAFALHRAIRPMTKLRHFSSLASSLAAPPKTLAPTRILSSISVPFAFTKAVNAGDKIRRTDGDENILRVLEDKIDAQVPLEAGFSKDSPFEIIDNPGDQSFKLEREFQGEKIEVVVYEYFDGDADADADEEESKQDAAEGQNTDNDRQPHISLVVTIDKAGPALRFWCNLYAEDFEIERMMMKRPKDSDAKKAYERPDYSEYIYLDEGLQRAFNEYLGARGINVSLYKFLREYFMTMDDRECIRWLKNLKQFVEK